MSFYDTGLPVPSNDPRDLDDNAKHIDELVNSTFPTFTDRLGTTRRTLAGIEADADAATLRGDLAASDGAELVTFTPEGVGAVDIELQAKVRENATVRDFGPAGTGNGVTDDSAAALAMASAMGFIRFSRGNYVINTATFDVPVSFDRKANVTIPTGQTLTITDIVESPKQNIFKGPGLVVLGHDSDSGENARQLHVSWFGAFPNPQIGPDQGPAIQRAFTAVGNGRESTIEFDQGNYNVDSQVSMTRGCHLKAFGQRRTVFKTKVDGFPLVTTQGIACRITGLQFELHLGVMTNRVSPFIQIEHEMCDLYDIAMGNSTKGIVINALRCRIDGVIAAYGNAPGAGSSLIQALQPDFTIKNVYCLTSGGQGPEAIVHVGGGSVSVGTGNIENIDSIMSSKLVKIEASLAGVSNILVSKLRYSGFSGTRPDAIVHLLTSGTQNMNGVKITDVVGTSYCEHNIKFEQNSSGKMSACSVDDIFFPGSNTAGIAFIQTAGQLDDMTVGPTADVRGSTTPFLYSGNPTRIRISPLATPDTLPVGSTDFTIADDSVAVINLRRSVFTGAVTVTAGYQNLLICAIRAATTPNVTGVVATANMAVINTALTGTTGVDGKMTIGVQDKTIYIENRLGSSQRVSYSLSTGIA
jgi:hypothetical protein